MRALMLLILFSSLSFCVQGQKLFRKTFDASQAGEIQIDARFTYRVKLHTHNSDQLILNARAEGEYGSDMLVNIWQEAATVFIGSNFQPDYKLKNDKLSAHKVMSLELDVFLPAGFDIRLSGGSVSVIAEGTYELLNVILDSGRCELMKVMGTVNVSTISGDIILKGGKGLVNANSQYGRIDSQSLAAGPSEYKLSSVKGDIRISRLQ